MPAPCGCDALAKAEKDPDPQGRAVLAVDAATMQARWRCPRAGFEIPQGEPEFDAEQRDALGAVERLTGFSGAKTCPCFYASLPWVHEAVEAYEDWDKGCLGAEHPHPSGALMDAVRLVRRGISARQADDFERMKRESERKRDAASE